MTMLTDNNLAQRIAARKLGDELLELILSESRSHGEFASVTFERIHTALGEIINVKPPVDPQSPMAYDEAREWERRTTIEFGQHRGELVKDVPLEYLLWLDGDKFRGELRRYLGSKLIQGQQDEQEEPDSEDEP